MFSGQYRSAVTAGRDYTFEASWSRIGDDVEWRAEIFLLGVQAASTQGQINPVEPGGEEADVRAAIEMYIDSSEDLALERSPVRGFTSPDE